MEVREVDVTSLCVSVECVGQGQCATTDAAFAHYVQQRHCWTCVLGSRRLSNGIAMAATTQPVMRKLKGDDMNIASLVRQGMTRSKVQFVLTAISIFIAFCLFGLLSAFRYAFEAGIDLSEASRLITMSRATLNQALPLGLWNEIKSVDGVDQVTHFTVFSSYFRAPENPINAFAVDADTVASVYGAEMAITPAQLAAWKASPIRAVAGRSLADKYHWHVGERVPLISQAWQREDRAPSWEFEIAAILEIPPSSPYAANFFLHYDYLDKARAFRKGTVGYYVLRTKDPQAAASVAEHIDARFANSADETRTSTEKAMFEFFARQFGDVGMIVTAILSAVFFTILLVIGNSISRSVRERTRELIVMRSIGFTDAMVIAIVLLEGISLTLVAGLPAMLLAWFIVQGISAQFSSAIGGIRLTGTIMLEAITLMLFLGIVASILPVLRVIRMNVASGLRRA